MVERQDVYNKTQIEQLPNFYPVLNLTRWLASRAYSPLPNDSFVHKHMLASQPLDIVPSYRYSLKVHLSLFLNISQNGCVQRLKQIDQRNYLPLHKQ